MIPLSLLLLGLLCALLVGYLAQWTSICMVRGIVLAQQGQPALLMATIFCGAWTWICVPLAGWFGVDLPMHRYEPAWTFAIGGLVFGVGAALNEGCAVSTLSKLARGHLRMLATVIGWIAGWTAWLWLRPDSMLMRASATPDYALWVLVAFAVLLTGWAVFIAPEQRRLWLGITVFGMVAGVLTLVETEWSPSSVITDLSGVLAGEEEHSLPALHRVALVLMIIAGMAAAAWRAKEFRLRIPRLLAVLKNFSAGTLMGGGAAVALGGNDVQLLNALPALSPAGIVAVVAMLAGIWLGLAAMGRLSRSRA